MSKFIFDELINDENIINSYSFDGISVNSMIYKLAKYNFYVNKMTDEQNYDAISSYMKAHLCGFVGTDWDESIKNCIKSCKKSPYKKVDSIKITKKELDYIKFFNDIKKEKVLFVLLCLAKYNHFFHHRNDFWVNESLSLIFREARVHIRSTERHDFLRQLFLAGAYDMPYGTGTSSKKIMFASYDENDDVVLELTEIDFEELAYTYLFYKDGFSGYVHCDRCGALTKIKANNQKYCKRCADEVHRKQMAECQRRRRNVNIQTTL